MSGAPERETPPAQALKLIATAARLLFANGQTTERMVSSVERLAGAVGIRAGVFPRWGELALRSGDEGERRHEIIPVLPAGVDMGKVAAATEAIERLAEGRLDAAAAQAELEAIAARGPVPLPRFAVMAAAGAAALAVIFGETDAVRLAVIAACAGAGACLRRWISHISTNLFVQPFGAALLAGAVGAVSARLRIDSAMHLIALCPCMVLVPGPHFLNGALDLARGRITLGTARLILATLITLGICAGLLFGLALGGIALPVAAAAPPVPLGRDVAAAGLVVAAYGTFFNMPWRTLPLPIAVGMAAHALRWEALAAGADPAMGAMLACLLVGTIMTFASDRLHLPFAGLAFASVVSLIPGVFLFRMAGGMVTLAALGPKAPPSLPFEIITDGTTAFLIVVAMAFGLIAPRICLPHAAPAAD